MPLSANASCVPAIHASSPFLMPQWILPVTSVGACMTTRRAPLSASDRPSLPPFDAFNLGDHVGDEPRAVSAHRQALASALGVRPVWMKQVHGDRVVRLREADPGRESVIEADGAWTDAPSLACTVMVADCLPILLAVDDGRAVAALHAGWRGLAGMHADGSTGPGIVARGVSALCEGARCDPSRIQAWIGPCIGPSAFEVGEEVLAGFGRSADDPGPHFMPKPQPQPRDAVKWMGHLAALARDRLSAVGVTRVSGGHWCTVSDSDRFFSFRRDGVTGRQAALIWRR